MFKLATERKFKAKINFKLPNETGGHTPFSFTATFKQLKVSEVNALKETSPDVDLVKEVLLGFEGVQLPDGTMAEFSDETRDALLDEPQVLVALRDTYLAEAIHGTGRRGN